MRSVVTTLAVVVCALSIAGCTADEVPTPVPTLSATSSPEPTPQTDVPAPSGPAAAVTLASVDVDGLNATVGGFITEAAEDGGLCQYVLTKDADGTTFTVETTGVTNVRSTSCGSVQVPIDKFSKGTWSVVLHYTSADLDLESAPLTMEIP